MIGQNQQVCGKGERAVQRSQEKMLAAKYFAQRIDHVQLSGTVRVS